MSDDFKQLSLFDCMEPDELFGPDELGADEEHEPFMNPPEPTSKNLEPRIQKDIPDGFEKLSFHDYALALIQDFKYPSILKCKWEELKKESTSKNFKKLYCEFSNTFFFHVPHPYSKEPEMFGVQFDFKNDESFIYHCGSDHDRKIFTFRLCELMYVIRKDGESIDRSYRDDLHLCSRSNIRQQRYNVAPDWVMECHGRCERCSSWTVKLPDDQPADGWGVYGICNHLTAMNHQQTETEGTSSCEGYREFDCATEEGK